MNTEKEKALSKWSENYIKQAGVEQPSQDFTAQVMKAVTKASEKPSLVYKPIISPLGWLCIAIVVAVLLGYTFYTSTSLETSIGLSAYIEQQLEPWSFFDEELAWQPPSSMTYGMLAVALWMGLEITLRRKHFQ